jgi:hypothetical protein
MMVGAERFELPTLCSQNATCHFDLYADFMRLTTSIESEAPVEWCGFAYMCEALLITVSTTVSVVFDHSL